MLVTACAPESGTKRHLTPAAREQTRWCIALLRAIANPRGRRNGRACRTPAAPRRHRGSAMEARKRGVKAATQPERARDDDEQLGSSGSDSGDDSVSSDEDVPKGSHARPGRAPKDEPEPDSDDWLLFLAAFLGFCIAMASAVALLRADTELDRSYVMGAAMVIIAVSAMGSSLCAKGKNTAGLEDDSVSPLLVFVVAGGFGLLLGGLFGDLSRRFPAGTILIPGVF
ncbi:hypothetical protein FNF28_05834 [Cafeteria roenbergensis]|uniref:Uncharacterized protein n=1 Tax=Cafeteria roenbergensis TaxID=33653 RepID=A0A5A8D6K3_CAFRO|nr:hypothetical protein FNF28_05834 [Cafeteria roenbergensis]